MLFWSIYGKILPVDEWGGLMGKVWTFVWVIGMGQEREFCICIPQHGMGQDFVDAWFVRGLAGNSLHQDQFRPSYITSGPLPLPSA